MVFRAVSLILALALGILSPPLAADAQQRGKIYRVGFLAGRAPIPSAEEAFRRGLRELGWVENQNIAIEYRWAEGKLDRLPDMAAELVRLKVDLIVAVATPSILAAKHASTAIPIVMVGVGDPVGIGIVASLARPGGNVTGVSHLVGLEILGKRLELLKEAVPNAARVAVLWNPTNPLEVVAFRQGQVPARALGVTLQSIEVRELKDFENAFAAVTRERAGALLVFEGPLANTYRRQIVDLAAKHRLPAMYGFREFVDEGGLMSYGTHLPDLYRRTAVYVDKILKGARPADLPVEQPTRFELVVNLKTAKALGLTIPQSVLIRADHVIQ